MEAWIDNDGYPVVILTRALGASTDNRPVSDAMVRWGRVVITDGTDTVTMVGGVDGSVFPPFSYRTYVMAGQVGRTYTVTAEYDGMRATATSRIPGPPSISGVEFDHLHDSLYSATLTFIAPDERDCRYVVFTRVLGKEQRHYPAFMGGVTSSSPGETRSVPLFRGKHEDSDDKFEPNFKLGDTVDVLLARVEPAVYDYWDAYHNQVYFGNNIFLGGSTGLPGNVEGGYGIFSARGCAQTRAVVR